MKLFDYEKGKTSEMLHATIIIILLLLCLMLAAVLGEPKSGKNALDTYCYKTYNKSWDDYNSISKAICNKDQVK